VGGGGPAGARVSGWDERSADAHRRGWGENPAGASSEGASGWVGMRGAAAAASERMPSVIRAS
jgi:hypothetical protein